MLTNTLNRSLNYLIGYYILLVTYFSLSSNDIEGAVLGIMALYLFPLLILMVSYAVIVVFEIKEYYQTRKINISPIIGSTIKIIISTLFMYVTPNKIDLVVVKIAAVKYLF